MPTARPSPHSHGPSEIWKRPAVQRTAAREQRRIGARLRGLRIERGLSQEAAAEAMGLHAKHLQRLEAGTANATLATLVAVVLVYKVPLRALFEDEDEGEATPGVKTGKQKARSTTAS